MFFRQNSVKTKKKKVFAGNWRGFFPKLGEELGLFRLIIQCSNLVGGTLNLDGGTRLPYNLSAGLTPNKNSGYANKLEIAWKKNFKDFFLENTCACVLGPWPWPRAFLSLASRVSVLGKAVLGLGLGFFLCLWPWPRALCPRLHLWQSSFSCAVFNFSYYLDYSICLPTRSNRICQIFLL